MSIVIKALKMNAAWSILHSFMICLMIVANRTDLLDWPSDYKYIPVISVVALALGSYLSLTIALFISIIGIFKVRSANARYQVLLVLSSIFCSAYFCVQVFMRPIY